MNPLEPAWDEPEVMRRLRVRCRRYGIEVEDFRRMWVQQRGRCGICRDGLDLRGTRIDHAHDFDPDLGDRYWSRTPDERAHAVRGLLCQGCNTVLGRYEALTDDDVRERIAWLEERLADAHRRLDLYGRTFPMYYRAVEAYLAGEASEFADDDAELLLAGRRLPWRDSAWAGGGVDLHNGDTIEFEADSGPAVPS